MMELLLRVLKWSLIAGGVTALVALTKPLLDRRFTPRWRYWLWLVLAAALLLSPVSLGALIPTFPEPAVTVTAPELALPMLGQGRPAPEAPGDSAGPDNLATPGDTATPGSPVASDEPHSGAAGRTVELSAVLTAVWLLGAAVFALWHILGTALLASRLRRWSVPAGGGIVSKCRELSAELGLGRTPKIGVSRGLASPMAVGLFRPSLWLPDRAWDGRELDFILRHELTHIKRRDLGYKALVLLANALHWFNPLIWLMRREAGETVELLCDAQALQGADRETRQAYCETLLDHIRRVPGTALTTHFYGGKRSVKNRFKNLLSGSSRRFGWTALAVCVLAAGVTACAVGVGASKSVPPEEFDGEFTANFFKYVFIRDENGQRIQNEAVLVNSLDELNELRRNDSIEPMDDGDKVINGDLVEKLDGYTRDYFRENVLIVLIHEMGTGSYELSAEGVELDGTALAVTLSSYNPTAPYITTDLCQWCVLIECKRVEGVTSAEWSFASVPDVEPNTPELPEDASLPERIGEELMENPSGAVLEVSWRWDVTDFAVTEENRVRYITDVLTGLDCAPSDASSLPEDEMSVLLESTDGRFGVRLGKSGGPLELIWDGASSFWDIPDSQRQTLWEELNYAAQNVPGNDLFLGVTADGSLSMDDAIAVLVEKMAQNVRALPDWVEWKPADFQSMEIEVADEYFGEPQNFCARLHFAIDFGPGGPEDPKYSEYGYHWTAGSSLEGPFEGEFEGYYGWRREVGVFRGDSGQWEVRSMGTENALAYLPGWTYTADVENSIYNAPLEELMQILTLSRGNTQGTVALCLCRKSPEELADLPSALTVLSEEDARAFYEKVLRHIEKVDEGAPSPSDTLILEALEEYIGE